MGGQFRPGGQTAWVATARDAAGDDLVLKGAWPHPDMAHEADALQLWRGDGAVRLYASVELNGASALLLERCVPGTMLARSPEPEQDVVLADLLRRQWREPPPGSRIRSRQSMYYAWADEFEQQQRAGLIDIDAGLARDGIALFRALPGTATRSVVLSTDPHAENVLAAEREPWLAIDPNPFIGDPTYNALQPCSTAARVLWAGA